jgi:hypothetical protein
MFCYGTAAHSGPRPPHYRGFMITFRHTTLSRTPLDESSARRADLYLTKQNTITRQWHQSPQRHLYTYIFVLYYSKLLPVPWQYIQFLLRLCLYWRVLIPLACVPCRYADWTRCPAALVPVAHLCLRLRFFSSSASVIRRTALILCTCLSLSSFLSSFSVLSWPSYTTQHVSFCIWAPASAPSVVVQFSCVRRCPGTCLSGFEPVIASSRRPTP